MYRMRRIFLLILAVLSRLGTRRRSPIQRILVLKPDALGDLLLATPALRQLRVALPEAQITGLVGPWSRVIWATNPDLDILLDLPFPGFTRASPNPLHPYWLLLRYAVLLRRSRYDAALLLRDDHWWGAALVALAGIPRRIGHAHPLCAPFLSDALPYDPTAHVTGQSHDVVCKLREFERDSSPAVRGSRRQEAGGRRQEAGGGRQEAGDATVFLPPATCHLPPASRLQFTPDHAAQAWAAEWIATNLTSGERLVAIHPGASGPTKAWPPERWAALSDALAAQNLRIVLTGGPAEVDLAAHISRLMRHPALSVAGATGIGQLAALLGHAALVVGGDTGPLHIAVSQGVPTIHLFGPSDPGRFGPWGDPTQNIVLRASVPCSPCSSFDVCPRHTDPVECMDRIALSTVLRTAHTLLKRIR
jgi:ADP-heptose:LPS heptosyltransferase